MDVARFLNDQYLCCDQCNVSGGWAALGKPAMRQNSTVLHLRCTHCGERIVAKTVGPEHSQADIREALRAEYQTLRSLQSAFPQDEQFSTLVPLGFFESREHAVMVTEFCLGTDLVRYLRKHNPSVTVRALRSAGGWLRRLHGSDRESNAYGRLGVADKLNYVKAQFVDVLGDHGTTREAFELLVRVGTRIGTQNVPVARQHGDFKAENLLYDGTRLVGFDLRWQIVGAVAYDLAPFLNHLWLSTVALMHPFASRRTYRMFETAFVEGYGDTCDIRVLRWAQLYFALCYLGRYRKRGRLGSTYANYTVRPLIRWLISQLKST